jgi:hypothetical protein
MLIMKALLGLTKKVRYGTTYYVNENEEVILKDCRECGTTRDIEEFTPNKNGMGGKHSKCFVCMNNYQTIRGNEYTREWQKNNPDKVIASTHNWRAKKLGLPAELTADTIKELREEQQGRCILSGLEDNLHLEHAVPLNNGGGSTYENCYFINEYLNQSMKTTNMFEWVKGQYNFVQRRFYNVLVPMMADRNGMTPKEYEAFVYDQYNKDEKGIG